jgi:outer membrane protein assembly factor BamD
MKKSHFLIAALIVSLAGCFSAGAYGQKKPKGKVKIIKVQPKPQPAQKNQKNADAASAEPDKVLYERAMNSVKHRKFIEGRLNLQTLINTYPDSEYLAKAKLGLADSFYKEGGTSNLIQAIEEYKNFIVFFPFLDEAAYAQMQVGMAHYQMMQKSDRDTSQTQAAEDEFQAFLLKYPQSQLVPQAEQHLRGVQEILADGDFRIARFYYVKQDYRASAARLMEVAERYPLYSQSDEALSMLGDVYLRAKQVSKNEDDKNHWADLAAQCYGRILRDYPLSKLAPDAKARLTTMGMPIPTTDPQAFARMQNEQKYAKQHHPNFVLKLPLGMIKSSPNVYAAAHSGRPNLNPPDDSLSATDVLKQGASGPSSTVAAVGIRTGSNAAAGGNSVPVETESSESSTSTPATNVGAQIIEAPAAGNASATTAPPDPAPENAAPPATASQSQAPAPPGTQPAAGDNSPAGGQQVASKSNPKGESTSKKKKGLHKLVPW